MSPDENLATSLAEEAGRLLVELRAGWDWESGDDPRELGRRGDQAANDLLLRRLADERPSDAVLSEEAADDLGRLGSNRVWIVDPLDGTREFSMEGRPDWAVHVALWERDGGITAAAVSLPAQGTAYSSGQKPPLRHTPTLDKIAIAVSESRTPPLALALAGQLGAELVRMGSAGAKTIAVLTGHADAYVHVGAMHEWDVAAPAGVATAGGLHVSRLDGSPVIFNQPDPIVADLLVCVPSLAPTILGALNESSIPRAEL